MLRDRLLPKLRGSARAGGFLVLTLVQLGAVEAHERLVAPDRRPAVFQRHMRGWVRRLLRMFGVSLSIEPSQAPPQRAKARLIVSNHRSPMDIAVLLEIFGGQVLSRGDLESWPVLGLAARKAGTIFVDRTDGVSGATAIRLIQKRLKNGATIIVFPEGTTFAGDEVQPFRAGAFIGAQHIDLEIVCVGVAYEQGAEFVGETFLQHLGRTAVRPRTRVAVRIGQPLPPSGRAAELAERLRIEVQSLVHQARADLNRAK